MNEKNEENKLEHPCFPQALNPSVRVWRYMDLAKFIWLLETGKLNLSRLDLLGDPHEGSTPMHLAELRDMQICELTKGKASIDMSSINRQHRKALFVNCWHLGDTESEAMWRLYCPAGNGVAIQTTYAKLVESVSDDPSLYIGRVSYIDYEKGLFPLDNMFYAVMHKRISFAHENEVRLVKNVFEYWAPESSPPLGITVDWAIEKTVEKIFINPYAHDYYQEAVTSVVRRICPSLAERVMWSNMRAAPVY